MKKHTKILIVFLALIAAALIFFGGMRNVFAQKLDPNPATPPASSNDSSTLGSDDPASTRFQIVPCSGVNDPRTDATEKECTYEDLIRMIQRFIQLVLYLLIPIVLGMIIYIGFKYLTANGDSGKLADAKRMIKPLLLGIFFIFAAWLIVYTFLDRILVAGEDGTVSGVPKENIVPAGIRR